jgi:hypothetical protein
VVLPDNGDFLDCDVFLCRDVSKKVVVQMMKQVIAAMVAALLAMGSGCATKKEENGFWNQRVHADAWGFTMVTPYGPFNLGYMKWQRNVNDEQEPAKPSDAAGLILKNPAPKGATIP